MNQGDDIAGTIHEVGEGVTEFKKGDRVAAFHEMMKPGGSYAEYGLAWDHTTFFLPENTRFEGTTKTRSSTVLSVPLTVPQPAPQSPSPL